MVFNSSICAPALRFAECQHHLRILFRPGCQSSFSHLLALERTRWLRAAIHVTTRDLKSVVVSDRASSPSPAPRRLRGRKEQVMTEVGDSASLQSLTGSSAFPWNQARFDAGELITQRRCSRQVKE